MNKRMFKLFKDKSKQDQYLRYYPDDKLIDVCTRKFKTQYEDMRNLRKNFDDFLHGIQNLTIIIENLYSCFKNIYEPDWLGNAEFHQSCQNSMKFWRNFLEDFKKYILADFQKYADKFPEIQRSIDKCNKKSTECQKQKAIYESYRTSRKPDNAKIKKTGDELKQTQDQYNEIAKELKNDLPQFCDSRLLAYINVWSLLFSAEDRLYQSLHEERIKQNQIIQKLSDAAGSGRYSINDQVSTNENHTNMIYDKQKAASVMTLFSSDRRSNDTSLMKGNSMWNIATDGDIYDNIPVENIETNVVKRNQSYSSGIRSSSENIEQSEASSYSFREPKANAVKKKLSFDNPSTQNRPASSNTVVLRENAKIPKENSSIYSQFNEEIYPYAKITKDQKSTPVTNNVPSPSSSRSDNDKFHADTISVTLRSTAPIAETTKSGFYYQVVAKYNYCGQDSDELNLKKDDIILVLPWEDEDQMEDGWLYGENVVTKAKGLFPENHTFPLN